MNPPPLEPPDPTGSASAPPTGLVARLGLFTATMVVVGNMIGSGVFKKAAPMAAELQSPGLLLLAWVIAGMISLFGALSNAEIAGLMADPGGQYAFFKRMYGRFFAWLFGWTGFAVIQCASVGSIAYVFGQSANALFVFPRLPSSWEAMTFLGIFQPLANSGVKAFTILTILLITLANHFGVTYGGLIANISSMLKIVGILILVVLGLTWSGGSWGHLEPLGPAAGAAYGSSLGLFGAMFSAMLGAFWAYDGWNNITYLGGEIRDPRRNIPLSLALGVAGVVGLYLLIHVAYLRILPVQALGALASQENTIVGVEVMRHAFGDLAAKAVAVLVMLGAFGAVNCQLLPPPRMYFAMARDGLFFRAAGTCHPTHNTPSAALFMQAGWTSLLVLSGTFDQLTDMVIFASFLFYGASAFGLFVLRRRAPEAPRTYRVHGYPIVPALFVLFCLVLVVTTVVERPRDAGIGLALILSGLPFYHYWSRNARPAR